MLTTEPEVIERYVRAGKLKLVFRDVLNHGERSERASEAAACAGRQGKFWQMHEVLFAKQGDTWGASGAGLMPLMLAHGKTIEGLNLTTFEACLKDRITLPQLKTADAQQREWGIVSQPMFDVGNGVGNSGKRLAGSQSIEAMSAAIDAALVLLG